MDITPEERTKLREEVSEKHLLPYAGKVYELLAALDKVESERDAYIRETGKYARECGLQDAEIGRLKERDEKAQARIEQLEAVAEAAKVFTTKYPDWGHYPVLRLVTKALRAAGYEV